jgi:hypothetical protein
VSPVKYELGSYIPEDDILHSHRRENLNSDNQVYHSSTLAKKKCSISMHYVSNFTIPDCTLSFLPFRKVSTISSITTDVCLNP